MTQKITTMLTMLVCFVSFAWSQQVALTPTTELTTGFYVIKTMSDKTNNGDAYVYGDTKNKQVRSTNRSDAFPALEGTTLTDDQATYIWEVTANTDGSIQIKNKSCDYYFGAFDQYYNTLNSKAFTIKQSFNVNKANNLSALKYSKDNNWFILKGRDIVKYKTGIAKYKNITVYVCANTDTKLSYSYYDTEEGAHAARNTAKFQFYKVEYDVPVAVSVTYNYLMDGNVKKSVKYECMTKEEFPEPTELPAYVSVAKPVGNVTIEDNNQTFDLTCTITTPFQISDDSKKHYYYLQNSNDTKTRIFANNRDMKFREDAQAEILNNVNGDLWYVTGNPFDGFQFHNVGANNVAQSTAALSNLCKLSFSGAAGNNDNWKIYKINDKSFGLYQYSNWFIDSGNVAWHYNNGSVGFKKIDTQSTPTDAAYAFTLTQATITLPLHNSAADNANFATTCLPYAVEVANTEGTVKTYAGKLNAEQTGLEMNEVSAVPANQGIIIKGNTTDNEVVLRVIDAAETIDNDLKGTTEELTDLTGVYSFGRANGTGNVGFFRSNNPTLKANRAYIRLDNSASQSIAMNFDGNIVSSIESVNTNNTTMNNAPVFDLTGRRVMKMVKGNLYIQNGRKFIAQ